MTLITIYSLIYLFASIVTIVLANKAQHFKDRHPAIDGAASLEAFKALARVNMYFALSQIVVLLAGMAVGGVIIFLHGATGFLFVMATNAILLLLSFSLLAPRFCAKWSGFAKRFGISSMRERRDHVQSSQFQSCDHDSST
ncbi:MAG: hypothetical protein GY719_24360, partial [bacterium]|nr:hypothetical protein [bacterium]